MMKRATSEIPAGRAAEKTLAETQLEALVWTARTHTEVVAKLASGLVNDVLLCELVTLDANGQATHDFNVSFGSVAITNHSAATVTAANAGPAGDPPGAGTGIAMVGALTGRTVNLTGRSLTLYGTAGARVGLEVFTKAQPPAWGRAGT